MGIGWIIGIVVGVLVIAGIVYLVILDSKKKSRALEEGELTHGWLVQANDGLFEDGFMDLPGLVVVSPDRETNDDEDFMTELADQIMELKGEDPDECDDKGEAKIAKWMADETYVEGRRDKLPKSFTDGKTVYLVHIMIYRDHLPGKRLGPRRKIPCAIIWDEKSLVCTRPRSKEELRKRDAELDEDDDD